MSKLSNNLKILREAHSWSKTEVAKKLKISPQRYSNWEYGQREPDIEMLKLLAKLYGKSIDQLTGTLKENTVDLKEPAIFSYGGKPVSSEDMEIIKAILERHNHE